MLDLAFWFFFIITPITIWFMLRIAGERINKISILNITTISIYVFSFIGLVPLYFKLDPYNLSTGITDQYLVFTILVYCFISIFSFLLGNIFIRRVLQLKPLVINSKLLRPLKKQNIIMLFCFFCLVLLVLFVYLKKVNKVAIFTVFTEGAFAASKVRSDMGNNFPKYHRYSFFMHDLGLIVALSFFTLWLQKRTIKRFVFFLFTSIVYSFICIMAIEKAPFIFFMFSLIMAYTIAHKDCLISIRKLIIPGIIFTVILTSFFYFFMGNANIQIALNSVFSRAFASSIAPTYYYLEYIPYINDFYWGKTFPNPAHIFPYDAIRYTVEIFNWKNPHLTLHGITGSYPTVFWGEAYVNFGFWGIPIISFIMGNIVSFVSYLISILEVNAVSIALNVWLIMHFMTLGITGFSGFLYDFNLIGISIFVLIILTVSGKLKIRKKSIV